jgi:hypothetical protein
MSLRHTKEDLKKLAKTKTVKIQIKMLKTLFSVDKRYVDTTVAKQKKILRLLIINHLINCYRSAVGASTVRFSDEYKPEKAKARQYRIHESDACWSTKNIMHKLKYNIYVHESGLIQDIQAIKRKLERKSATQSRASSGISHSKLTSAISKVVNSMYPDSSKTREYVERQVMRNIEKEKSTVEEQFDLPNGIDPVAFTRYLALVKPEIENTEYVKIAVVRYMLVKHLKIRTLEADKILESKYEKTDKQINATVKKIIKNSAKI